VFEKLRQKKRGQFADQAPLRLVKVLAKLQMSM
jgi:hypothetical protein